MIPHCVDQLLQMLDSVKIIANYGFEKFKVEKKSLEVWLTEILVKNPSDGREWKIK